MLDCEWIDYLLFILWDVVIEVLRHRTVPNHQPIKQQETVCEITNPTPNEREIEMLINCCVWITSPRTHTLLKASLSCTLWKTMKQ